MGIARSINHVVVATEGIARAIILAALVVVLYYAADREPPFKVLAVQPSSARPGEYISIRASVIRETWRQCNAEYSRYMFDATNTRFNLGTDLASHELIEAQERKTPGMLMLKFRLPEAVQPGPAILQTVLQYRCNRTHAFWPIDVTTEIPFTVLP